MARRAPDPTIYVLGYRLNELAGHDRLGNRESLCLGHELGRLDDSQDGLIGTR